jgi:cation transport regulator ChaC
MPEPLLYFAYGSNLSETQMESRCPGSEVFQAGALPGFKLAFIGERSHWGEGGTATVVADGDGAAPGVLYRVTPVHVEALNRWEGYPEAYGHLRVEVPAADGKTYPALTYQRLGTHPTNPPPMVYLAQIWRAYRRFGLDEAHLLAAVEESLNGTGNKG